MTDDPSNDLVDGALADEIELVSDLVVAASSVARHFTPDEVDALLGIGAEKPGESQDAGESVAPPGPVAADPSEASGTGGDAPDGGGTAK
jgi:hypothetical protein